MVYALKITIQVIKYKMLLKTTSKETLILDKNKQPIKRMGEDSIVFAKPEIIEKEGKEYLKVICFDNNGMTEGLVKRDELKPSQIYDEGELKDIDKLEIRGTKAKKVMNSDGKHLGEVEVEAENEHAVHVYKKRGFKELP